MFLSTVIEFLRSRALTLVGIGITFVAGAAVGWLHEHDKLVAYRASVESIAAEQEIKNRETIAKHNQTTRDIHKEYANALDRLHQYYNGRLRDNKNTRGMPANSTAASRTSNPSPNQPLTTTERLECAESVLKLIELQKWVREITSQ